MASVAVGGNPIGDLLLQEGLLTRDQLMAAVAEAKSSRLRLSYVVAKSGAVPETEVTKMLARQYRMPAVDLASSRSTAILKLIPGDLAMKHLVLPLKRDGRTLTVAMADPTDLGLLDDLKFITRYDIFPVIAGEFTLRTLIEKHYERPAMAAARRPPEGHRRASRTTSRSSRTTRTTTMRRSRAQIDDAPVVKLINAS